jgi:hypothetical protein
LGNQVSEVAGVSIQRKDTDEPSDCGYVGGSGPFSKGIVFIDSVLDASDYSLEILCDSSG